MTPILKALMIFIKYEVCSTIRLKEIDNIFSEAGFQRIDDSDSKPTTRSGLVSEYYGQMNWEERATIDKFYQVIRNILKLPSWQLKEEYKKYIATNCQELGIEINDREDFYLSTDPFVRQFPVGLPFGKIKPNFSIKAEKSSQNLQFEWQDGLGILKCNIYPNFSFQKLSNMLGCTPETDGALRSALLKMNQTECERKFFLKYAKDFEMANKDIPVLIPQAWIQWHSIAKKSLNSGNILNADDINRIDFVAFWNNKRFAIQIDDISHYGVQKGSNWLASEESYLKTLKEERNLTKEDWNVFRLSNFEIKNDELLVEALNDVKLFLNF